MPLTINLQRMFDQHNTDESVGVLLDGQTDLPVTPRTVTRFPGRTIVTQFQSGHGWTISNAGAAATANDTSTFILGSQSAKVQTLGSAGQFSNITKSTGFTIDTTGKLFRVWFLCDAPINAIGGHMYLEAATESSFTNYYRFDMMDNTATPGAGLLYANEWQAVTLGFDHATTVGSPTRGAITSLRLRLADGGTAYTVNWQAIDLVADASATYPNGVISICFDDCYQSQWTIGQGKLAQYGFAANLFPIISSIGSSTLTLSQIKALQDFHGWEVCGHAYAGDTHNATYQGVTIPTVVNDLYQAKLWAQANGIQMHHGAYPSGLWSPDISAALRQYFRTFRTVYFATGHETWPPAMPMKLRAAGSISSFTGGRSAATITAAIDACKANATWLILVFHKIVTTTPAATTECLQADFNTIIDYINTTSVPVRTISEVTG